MANGCRNQDELDFHIPVWRRPLIVSLNRSASRLGAAEESPLFSRVSSASCQGLAHCKVIKSCFSLYVHILSLPALLVCDSLQSI